MSAASGEPDVDVVVTGEPVPLDAAREVALLRTAQEAVGNARRHADAHGITVTLSWLGDTVILDTAGSPPASGPDRRAQRPRSRSWRTGSASAEAPGPTRSWCERCGA